MLVLLEKMKDYGTFLAFALAPKDKLCYTIDKIGTPDEKKTSEGFHETNTSLTTIKYFKIKDGGTIKRELYLPLKRSFAQRIGINK